jgi:hypothetical protein
MSEAPTRTANLLSVTRRLILMTGGALLCVVAIFGLTLIWAQRFNISWACFGCGLIGGFVSIQQRLKKIGDAELTLLATSWFQIVLIPVYGGIFALVLYVGLLSKIVVGDLFPAFYIPAFHSPPIRQDIQLFLSETSPATGPDVAKLLFWCFLAGFSERLIPQIISNTGGGAGGKG